MRGSISNKIVMTLNIVSDRVANIAAKAHTEVPRLLFVWRIRLAES
jgi:hypothetical protein